MSTSSQGNERALSSPVEQTNPVQTFSVSSPSNTHPLHTKWTMWYNASLGTWDPTSIFTVATVEDYWALYKHLMLAGDLPVGAEYYLFREGVRPEWEHTANQKGGSCTVHLPYDVGSKEADEAWKWLSLSAIGETIAYSEEIVGVIFSRKKASVRLSIWLRNSKHLSSQNSTSEYFRTGLRLDPSIQITFVSHASKYAR